MLPFIAGLAVGVGAVVAYNNKDKLKEMANDGFEKSKEFAKDIKDSADGAMDCVKEKMQKSKEEEEKAKQASTKKAGTRKTKADKQDDK